MENQKLTQRPEVAYFTDDAVIHIAEPDNISQGPDGSSFKIKANRLLNRTDFGKITKMGKGFTISPEGVFSPNTGPMSLHEKGDLFRCVTPEGKYVPYMRYKGTGEIFLFTSFCYEIEINALLPDEPGYIAPDEE